ncbi:hypothetical protein, partial [Burkholderia sp. SIMBA_051]|uniref:hypothetical protein n=1 Tax=Burkholderia sp. SIMBA_051 TaxID=3085792 RepID=UPI003978D635
MNTANGRRTNGTLGSLEENLCQPDDVATWALRATLVAPSEYEALLGAIKADTTNAANQLAALIAFRDRLYR